MKTAFLKDKELTVLDNVYEPSEDSFLLAENVNIKQDAIVLDLGTGTGIQGINAAILGAKKVVCTDINRKALENAKKNANKLGFSEKFEFRQGNLFDCLNKGEKFDTILFNPPYVVSDEKKFEDLDGGKKGRETLDKFLEKFDKFLDLGGECFFLQTDLNGEKETLKKLEEKGFTAEKLAEKRAFFETLIVFKSTPKK